MVRDFLFLYPHKTPAMNTLRTKFLQHVAQTSGAPLALEIEHAEGIYLYGAENKKYIDLISGIGVSSLGHGNPQVVEAIKTQAEKYMHLMVYGEYVQKPQVQLAEKLCSYLPQQLNSIYFTNSGTEAVEGAMKLAKRATGRRQIIAARNAYHGSTQGALSLMSSEYFTQAFRPLLPEIYFVDYNNISQLDEITTQTAAVFIETIQGEAGYIAPQPEYLEKLRQKCNETGTLLVLDEIQCGMGRTGTLFAFEQYGIVPDVLLLAKALGAGMPLGAFVASQQLMGQLADNPVLGHITTFGGHPMCCAAALAGLDYLINNKLAEKVAAKEQLFRSLLHHKAIKNISGKGLMLGIDFGDEELNKQTISRCIDNGVITDWFLHAGHKMRLAPPLIITEDEIKTACSLILKSVNEVCA